MDRLNRILFFVQSFLFVVLYAAPFFIEAIARKHIMFYRYLIVKQQWWINDMFYFRIIMTIVAIAAAIYILCIAKKTASLTLKVLFTFSSLCLIISIIVMNIDPYVTLMHFLFLLVSAITVLVSLVLLIIAIMAAKKHI